MKCKKNLKGDNVKTFSKVLRTDKKEMLIMIKWRFYTNCAD